MLKLDKGYSQYGAQMGRRNELPDDPEAPIKLRMEALRWVDYDYDQGGAYWGNSGNKIYCAHGYDDNAQGNRVLVFVRADDRAEARELVAELVPGAKFYR